MLMDSITKKTILDNYHKSPKGWGTWIRAKKNKYLIEALDKEFPKVKGCIREQVYWLDNGMKDFNKCPVCGSDITSFINPSKGYYDHCSCHCARVDPVVQEKYEKTAIENYGVPNPAQSTIVQDRMKKACLENFGVENAFQSKEIQNKIKQVNLERYGTDNPSKSKIIRKRSKKTLMERYGITCGFHNTKNIHRSRGEIELFKFIKSLDSTAVSTDRKAIYPLELDVFIERFNLAFEYDGDYWHNLPNMKERDRLKDDICKQAKIHLVRVTESDWNNRQDYVKGYVEKVIRGYQDEQRIS